MSTMQHSIAKAQAERHQALTDRYYAYERDYRALSAKYLLQAQESLDEAQSYDINAASP